MGLKELIKLRAAMGECSVIEAIEATKDYAVYCGENELAQKLEDLIPKTQQLNERSFSAITK